MGTSFFQKPYQIIHDMEIKELFAKMNEQSKDIAIPDFSEDYQEEEIVVAITPAIQKQERVAVYASAANYEMKLF
jgi:hypothetical protein